MLTCEYCKMDFEENQRLPIQNHDLCGLECADQMLDEVVKDVLAREQAARRDRQPDASL